MEVVFGDSAFPLALALVSESADCPRRKHLCVKTCERKPVVTTDARTTRCDLMRRTRKRETRTRTVTPKNVAQAQSYSFRECYDRTG